MSCIMSDVGCDPEPLKNRFAWITTIPSSEPHSAKNKRDQGAPLSVRAQGTCVYGTHARGALRRDSFTRHFRLILQPYPHTSQPTPTHTPMHPNRTKVHFHAIRTPPHSVAPSITTITHPLPHPYRSSFERCIARHNDLPHPMARQGVLPTPHSPTPLGIHTRKPHARTHHTLLYRTPGTRNPIRTTPTRPPERRNHAPGVASDCDFGERAESLHRQVKSQSPLTYRSRPLRIRIPSPLRRQTSISKAFESVRKRSKSKSLEIEIVRNHSKSSK